MVLMVWMNSVYLNTLVPVLCPLEHRCRYWLAIFSTHPLNFHTHVSSTLWTSQTLCHLPRHCLGFHIGSTLWTCQTLCHLPRHCLGFHIGSTLWTCQTQSSGTSQAHDGIWKNMTFFLQWFKTSSINTVGEPGNSSA
jgi:hypothetical protein